MCIFDIRRLGGSSIRQNEGVADVVYVTRVQKERFETVEAYEAVQVSERSLLSSPRVFQFQARTQHN